MSELSEQEEHYQLQIRDLEGHISTLNRQATDAVSIDQAAPPPAVSTLQNFPKDNVLIPFETVYIHDSFY